MKRKWLSQIVLLFWKQQIQMRRRKGHVFCEFLLPTLLVAVSMFSTSYIFKYVNISHNRTDFKAVPLKGNFADLSTHVTSINNILTVWDCSSGRRNITLAYSYEHASKDSADMIMNRLESWYNGSRDGAFSIVTRPFDRLERMKAVLHEEAKDETHDIRTHCRQFIGGVHFSKVIFGQSAELKYTFLMPQNILTQWTMENIDKFWLDNAYMLADHNQIPSDPPYWSSGLLSLQYAIEKAFIELTNGKKSLANVGLRLRRLPIPKQNVMAFVVDLAYSCFLFIFFLFAYSLIRDIAMERDSGIMAYMSVMGLSQFAFYSSHFLFALIKILPFSLIIGLIFVFGGLIESDPFLFIALLLLSAVVLLTFALFLTTLFKKFTLYGSIFVMVVLCSVAYFASPNLKNIPLCVFASLNPFGAFTIAKNLINIAEAKMNPLGWSSLIFSSGFSFGMAFLMLLFDLLLFSLLAVYVTLVLPSKGSPKRHPLFFLKFCGFRKFMDRSDSDDEQTEYDEEPDGFQKENIEPDSVGQKADCEADIVVDKLCKKWHHSSAQSQFTVDRLSFKAFRGQITALLGQNGAGKTTVFSVLTGLTKFNAGRVLISGIDLKEKLRQCQSKIGYCPQYNPLFDLLTVKEHLQFYAATKSGYLGGLDGRKASDQEILSVANELDIESLLFRQSNELSGGQKRKLSVAIALIGKSSVVLLDEPSAGMDTNARRNLGQLLKNIKQDRTILMTTHYMEEADKVSDRIVIIADGRLVCNGSPHFLKHRFGTGYCLTIVLNTERVGSVVDHQKHFRTETEAIYGLIRKHSPDAYIENARNPPEFSVILPTKDQKHFAPLFKELEQRMGDQRPIKSFGLSLNTLEQVFLRASEFDGPLVQSGGADSVDGATKIAQDLFGWRQQQFLKSSVALLELYVQQLFILLCRQFLWLWRNPSFIFLFFLYWFLVFMHVAKLFDLEATVTSSATSASRSLSSHANNEYISIPLQFDNETAWRNFTDLANKIPYAKTVMVHPNTTYSKLISHFDDDYPMLIGASVYRKGVKTVVDVLFNGIAFHSPPLALSFVTNALLGNLFAIVPEIEVYNVGVDANNVGVVNNFVNGHKKITVLVMLTLVLTLEAHFFIKLLVEERSSNFKHQLLLTRLHPIIYWAAFFLFHLTYYSLFCFCLAVPIFVYGTFDGFELRLLLMFVLFFWAHHPWLCCASFLSRDLKVGLAAALGSIGLTLIVFMVVYGVRLIPGIPVFGLDILHAVELISCFLLPTYGYADGMFTLVHLEESIDYNKGLIISMILSGIFYWAMLICLQSHAIVRKWNQLKCQIFNHNIYRKLQSSAAAAAASAAAEDEDVRHEREFVEQHGPEHFILCVNELTKYYGNLAVVDGITFGVQPEDCFGLLGVNGAGKTTTFEILAGIKFATSGTATISGVDVSAHPSIGFCPQFDALPMELTGREVLRLIAHLNGLSNVSEKTDTILKCIQMDKHADKFIRLNSGGQRRRISLGVALLTCSNFVMLDEPTAGIDPGTRRSVWQLIRAIRQQRIAILLTSHSMEECDALCNRIAFLNKGKLNGIGTSQHLKSRYGQSFTLTITVVNPGKRVYDFLHECVCSAYEGTSFLEKPSGKVCKWAIPKRSNVNWSDLYQNVQELADKYPADANLPPGSHLPRISDFSLVQSSLEQVFIQFSKESKPLVGDGLKHSPSSASVGKVWEESKL